MRLRRVDGVRRAERDVRVDDDQRRALRLRLRVRNRLAQQTEVVRIADVLHVPTLRLEPCTAVLPEGDRRRAVDRDVVVVVEVDELAETEVAGERRRFVRYALHEIAVRRDAIDAVIDDLVVRTVVALGEEPLGHAEADAVREPLAERPGRHLDAGGVMHLGVPGRLRLPLAEALQLFERQVVAGEVERAVLEDAGVPRAQDEAVAVGPLRIRRAVIHHLRVEEVGERRERHRRSRVTGVRLLDRVHRERANRVDRQLFDVSLGHEAPRTDAAGVPGPNDMRLPCLPADGTPPRAAPPPPRCPRRSSVATAAPRSDASSIFEAVTGRARASAMIWIQPGSESSPPPVATISSSSGKRSAIAENRNATPSSAAWRMSRAVVSKVSPAMSPFASGSQPIERSPPRNVRKVSPWSSGSRSPKPSSDAGERLVQPGVEVAAVGERASLDDAALVQPVEKETGPRLGALRLVQDPKRSGGADHQGGPCLAGAAGAEVRAGSVDHRRIPAVLRARPRCCGRRDSSRDRTSSSSASQRCSFEVEEAGAGRDREAAGRRNAEQLLVEVVAERDEPRRAAKDVGVGLGEPHELRGPEARMDVRSRARLHCRRRRPAGEAIRRRRRSACPASRARA